MKRIYLVITIYILCVLGIFAYKPAMMFDANGDLKKFDYDGDNNSGSLLSIEITLGILAIFCYFIVLSLELVLSN